MEVVADASMLDAAGRALLIILEPSRMALLCLGVMIGLVIGILPGIGGLTGFALLIPFTFTMDPYSAFALLLGMASVTAISDTIPAVLFGIPGSAGAQAVVIEGLPMAKRGEAGRALSAAYTASLIGGLFGAFVLGISIPLLRPFVLAIGSPEILALAVLGISMVVSLSGNAPAKGLVVAGFGIVLAMIGTDPRTGTFRWTMGTLYLWDGLPLLPMILGMFALPEIADLAIKRTAVAQKAHIKAGEGMVQGIRDAFSNIFLIIRCSTLGAAVGAIPGVASSVVDWLAYGHAVRSSKKPETFGKGDVRGVIAPESANNATQGGQLVPTLAFGVPGGPSMALFLGAVMIHGIVPGPEMLASNLDITYSMVWSVALANVVGAGICFLFAGQLAKLTQLRYTLLLPAIVCITFIGAYQASRSWGDIYVLLIFGVIGWVMKRLSWPRPPLVLGFVLGIMIERYLTISISRYGFEWLLRPGVMALLGFALLMLAKPTIEHLRKLFAGGKLTLAAPAFPPSLLFYIPVVGVALYMLMQASQWTYLARVGPIIILSTILVACAISILGQILQPIAHDPDDNTGHFDVKTDMSEMSTRTMLSRAGAFAGWLALFSILTAVIGLLPTAPLFMILYMRVEGRERWLTAILYALCVTAFIYVVFERTLHVPWPRSLLGEWFPILRSTIPSM